MTSIIILSRVLEAAFFRRSHSRRCAFPLAGCHQILSTRLSPANWLRWKRQPLRQRPR